MILSATSILSEDSERIILREKSFCKFSQANLSPITVELKPEVSFNFSIFSFSLIDISLVNLVIPIYLIVFFLRSKINRKDHKIGKN